MRLDLTAAADSRSLKLALEKAIQLIDGLDLRKGESVTKSIIIMDPDEYDEVLVGTITIKGPLE